jgi:hypothetical protein
MQQLKNYKGSLPYGLAKQHGKLTFKWDLSSSMTEYNKKVRALLIVGLKQLTKTILLAEFENILYEISQKGEGIPTTPFNIYSGMGGWHFLQDSKYLRTALKQLAKKNLIKLDKIKGKYYISTSS